MRRIVAMLFLLLLPAATGAQGTIRGRVVIESSRQGLNGANILVRADTTLVGTAITDAQGFFSIRLPAGSYKLTAGLIGYASQEASVTVAAADVTMPAFVLKAESVLLNPVEINVKSDRSNAADARGKSLVWGQRMARFEQQGARMVTVVRNLTGLRVSEFSDRDGRPRVCVQAARPTTGLQSAANSTGCPWVEIVIDGVPVGPDEALFRTFHVADYESAEFIDGIDAQRYGSRAGQFGALVLWTRGRGPYATAERNKN